jgi:hypothetical protein
MRNVLQALTGLVMMAFVIVSILNHGGRCVFEQLDRGFLQIRQVTPRLDHPRCGGGEEYLPRDGDRQHKQHDNA